MSDLEFYVAIALIFIVIVAIGFLLTDDNSNKTRSKAIARLSMEIESREKPSVRKKQIASQLDSLRDEQKKTSSLYIVPKNIQNRIDQAGLRITASLFWILSAILGCIITLLAFLFGLSPFICIAAGAAAFLGVPRWILGFFKTRRLKKFTNQFADGLDVIVRGVKSGLPLHDCIKVIATESPEPMRNEFSQIVDQIGLGTPLQQAIVKLYHRVPIPEVNFFSIVISIQAQSGGNLSEALGNLSTVIRSRKLLGEKIKALSSEAKTSAWIVGGLPPVVILMTYLTSPAYILTLFIHPTGHMILLAALVLMGIGTFVMRRMINFEY